MIVSKPPAITPKQLHELIEQGASVELIDVRTPAEYQEVHATIARSVPLDGLDPRAVMADRTVAADQPLYVICRSGARAARACEAFAAAGYPNVVNVEGGTLAWERAGLPVTRSPRKTLPMDRQVRIASGTVTVVGTLLGAFVHPAFLFLPFMCGARGIYSGITDSCLMSRVLSFFPWNRFRATEQAQAPNEPCCRG